jgi:prostatic aicd phosphatase
VPSQVYATAPDEKVLTNAATAFLQGLYPPLESVNPQLAIQTINNGSSTQNPLTGYQYVFLHGADANSPDAIWIKGDNGCPALTTASESFEDSSDFRAKLDSTKSFYNGFWDLLNGVYDYMPEKLNYAKAYDIFDLINVASVHNTSLPRNVTGEDLFQLRTLADSAEFAHNFNASQPARSIGGQTLTGAILNQLNQTVTTKGKLKFSLLAISYDSFLAFFGLSNLTSASPDFFGLPDYASTMAFDLFTPENTTSFPADINTLNVRFLFRNGSSGALRPFPLFGRSEESITWTEFAKEMKNRAITDVRQWCQACSSTEPFCAAYTTTSAHDSTTTKGGMSNAVAGVIGAMVTLGVLAICGALALVLLRRRKGKAVATMPTEKARSSSGSESESA